VTASRGAHAAHPPAAEVAHHVDLVRALAEHDAGALLGVDLVRHQRTDQPVVVVPGLDVDDPAELARADDLAHPADRRVVDLGMALHVFHAVLLDRLDHRLALVERHRHRLFADHVLAALRGMDGVLGMQRVRRRHPDRVHLRAVAHRLDRIEHRHVAAEPLAEQLHVVAPDVGEPGELDQIVERLEIVGDLERGDADARQAQTHACHYDATASLAARRPAAL
jgi:hypothetical protein